MKFRLGRKKIIATAGDVVVVPAGSAHTFANAGDELAQVRVEVRPALKMEELFETTVALACEVRTNRRGMPKPLVWIAQHRGLAERYVGAALRPAPAA